jgi:4,5-DOPA dioxygenase extradiol
MNVLFLSHGGGPMPLLGDAGHADMVACLQHIAGSIEKPSAILVVSAHWEAEISTITSAAAPSLIYDYYGFPEESYSIEYPCLGQPELANRVHEALLGAGIAAKLDDQRGFDHGVFVPLKIMYPDAEIPCVQLSLLSSLDPEAHLQMGRALRALADSNVLIIGSGFSFHNMQAFFSSDTTESKAMNESFEKWLQQTCASAEISEEERSHRLLNWQSAPAARYCHPREEHLLPIHVCYGATGERCSEIFTIKILNKKSSMFLWSAKA